MLLNESGYTIYFIISVAVITAANYNTSDRSTEQHTCTCKSYFQMSVGT